MPAIRSTVEALLIVEVDGPAARSRSPDRARRDDRQGMPRGHRARFRTSEEERLLFWAGRKAAFPAVGRISPDYYCMDGTIPRAKLPLVLHRMKEMSEKYGLRVANVFHAGDGNLHPLILYDANKPGELDRAEAIRRRNTEALRRGRRRADRRARRRRREARPDAGDVLRNRSQRAAARQMRLRPQGPAQSRQGIPDSCTAAPNWAACIFPAASCRSRTFRGFKLHEV